MEQIKDIIWAKESCHVVAKTACCTDDELWACLQACAIFHLEVYFWLVDGSVLDDACHLSLFFIHCKFGYLQHYFQVLYI